VAPSYFQQYFVEYRDEHFVAYKELTFLWYSLTLEVRLLELLLLEEEEPLWSLDV